MLTKELHPNRITEKEREPFRIVCLEDYEFEGIKFKVGDIEWHYYGHTVVYRWRKATEEDIYTYDKKKSLLR